MEKVQNTSVRSSTSVVAIEAQGNWTALRPAKDLYLKNNGRIDAYQAELAEIAKGSPKTGKPSGHTLD